MTQRKRMMEKGKIDGGWKSEFRSPGKEKGRTRIRWERWSFFFLPFVILLFLMNLEVCADYYSPADSVPLTIGTVSIKSDSVQNCDSIRIKWWRLSGTPTYVGTKLLTSSVETGFYATNVKASDASNSTGNYMAKAVAYKFGGSYTDIKTWSWRVVEAFDSLTNAIKDANKVNFKADVSNLINRGDSSLYMRSDWSNVKNQSAGVNFTQTRILGVNGDVGYLNGDNGNVVRNACADAHSDSGWTKVRAERQDLMLIRADSSYYMRTDWNNIKNKDAVVNFSHTRFLHVDSLGEEIYATVDTSEIKAMNVNNLWGAPIIWNYSTRTLTSGAGSGANGVVIRCKNSSDSSTIAFAQIQVLDSTESSTIGLLTSDSQGRGFFALDNGIYCVRLYKPGWQFTVPETLRVNGNEDTIYYALAFDPGNPPLVNLCRVYGWIYDIRNQPVVGAKIEASIKTIPVRYQNVVISPYYKYTVTGEDGFWYLDLYPNSVLTPSETKYIFILFSPSGTILRLETRVPDLGSWELQW